MKAFIAVLFFSTLTVFSLNSSAEDNSLIGTWYLAEKNSPKGPQVPEALIIITDAKAMTGQYLFLGSKQKYVRTVELKALGNNQFVPTKVIHETKCNGTSMTGDDRPASFVAKDNQLIIQGVLTLTKATPEQIKKFEDLQEGCE